MEEEKVDIKKQVLEQTENIIEQILQQGLSSDNIDFLMKVVDVHKDIENENYWKEKKEMYRDYERGYGDYSAGSYGRRGVPGTGRGRYRGEEALDEMKYHYGNYMDSYSYGAKEDSSAKMINCFKEFGFSIAEELDPKDKMMFKKAMQDVMQELN